jgi:hypothetical protein
MKSPDEHYLVNNGLYYNTGDSMLQNVVYGIPVRVICKLISLMFFAILLDLFVACSYGNSAKHKVH